MLRRVLRAPLLPLVAVHLGLLVLACGPSRKSLQSNDILQRQTTASAVAVKHILVEDDAVAKELLGRVRGGEPIEPLMMQYSKDPGSAQSGEAYDVTADSRYVPEFKDLALRLEVGEAGLVLSEHGWHIMKRVR
jgi:parvulin-like peptidyl-prolyl isomerase